MALLARAALSGIDLDTKSDGYTQAQQFFLGAVQSGCNIERPEYLRMSAQTDTHSPDTIRVNGALVNMPEFARAFGCKAGQPMAPVKKVPELVMSAEQRLPLEKLKQCRTSAVRRSFCSTNLSIS
jgi:predicted metalloendopeptidase